jgi:hypothetical protein
MINDQNGAAEMRIVIINHQQEKYLRKKSSQNPVPNVALPHPLKSKNPVVGTTASTSN